MEVEASPLSSSASSDDRWNHLQTVLTRSSPLAHPEFEPSEEVRGKICSTCAYSCYYTDIEIFTRVMQVISSRSGRIRM